MRAKNFLKKGFTLGEVLITMTIIGCVAAMTLPNLMYKKTDHEFSTKLKKFYSKADNSVFEMEMETGNIEFMQKPADSAAGYQWYIKYLDSYIGHQFVDSTNKIIYLKDGSSVEGFNVGDCLEIVYDVNAKNLPNKDGIDKFTFLVCFDKANRLKYFGSSDSAFGTYGKDLVAKTVSRADMISACKSKTTRKSCTRLLENDDWKFKGDYPKISN